MSSYSSIAKRYRRRNEKMWIAALEKLRYEESLCKERNKQRSLQKPPTHDFIVYSVDEPKPVPVVETDCCTCFGQWVFAKN